MIRAKLIREEFGSRVFGVQAFAEPPFEPTGPSPRGDLDLTPYLIAGKRHRRTRLRRDDNETLCIVAQILKQLEALDPT